MQPVALLASYWNIPVFGYVANGDLISDKSIYTTLIRVSMTQTEMAKALSEFLSYQDWSRAVLVWNSNILSADNLADGVKSTFPRAQIKIAVELDLKTVSIQDALTAIRDSARSKDEILKSGSSQ